MVSSTKFQSKADLLIKIKQVKLLLNGRYRDGSKLTFASDFKYIRYACVLLAALSLSNFEYLTKKIQDETFVGYFSLYKVATHLGLVFERSRAAAYIYRELTARGHVKTVVENSRTYITFTKVGRINCEQKLGELQLLNEEINENPFELQKYKIRDKERLVKGELPQETETTIDKLIKEISRW